MTALAKFIKTIIYIQENFPGRKFDCPDICIIGGQSAGKSSVVESLVGREFLPRNGEMATRAITRISLFDSNNLPPEHPCQGKELAEFGHRNGLHFRMDQIKEEIERQTNFLTGNNPHDVTDTEIRLTIYLPGAYDLTFVDVPGLISSKTKGQTENTKRKIVDMTLERIKNKSSIIVIVAKGDDDLGNSPAFDLITDQLTEFPDLKFRTVCVLTRADTCTTFEKREQFKKRLRGGFIELKQRYVPVIGRDTTADKKSTIDRSLQDETEYFRKEFPDLGDSCGAKYLGQRLSDLLLSTVKASIPDMQRELKGKLSKAESELLRIEEMDVVALPVLLSEFRVHYEQFLMGESLTFVSMDRDDGGYLFRSDFRKLSETLDQANPLEGLSVKLRLQLLKNAGGPGQNISPHHAVFLQVIRGQINKLHRIIASVVPDCKETLAKSFDSFASTFLAQKGFGSCKRIQAHLKSKLDEVVQEYEKISSTRIPEFVEMQAAFINLDHPEISVLKSAAKVTGGSALRGVAEAPTHFIGALLTFSKVALSVVSPEIMSILNAVHEYVANGRANPQQSGSGGTSTPEVSSDAEMETASATSSHLARMPTEEETDALKDIDRFIKTYYSIVKRRLIENIPLIIMKTLVLDTLTKLGAILIADAAKQHIFELVEDDVNRSQRAELLETVRKCKEVLEFIQREVMADASVEDVQYNKAA
ncbi:Dynamin-1-like protein [Gonapodya sp. JEL0774]|nr:Dynamin-1-like protein [Gonapodya sp. JEL0774]